MRAMNVSTLSGFYLPSLVATFVVVCLVPD